jgi:hypothetical protein
MKLKTLAILFMILASLIPIYYINQLLQRIIQPRKSFLGLMLYMLTGLALVFVYTFLLVFIIEKLFPV